MSNVIAAMALATELTIEAVQLMKIIQEATAEGRDITPEEIAEVRRKRDAAVDDFVETVDSLPGDG